VGDPCTPEDEVQQNFSGFSVDEVNVESRSFQCITRVCLVNHFQGRVSCPYGNSQSTINTTRMETGLPECQIPGSGSTGGDNQISVAVDPQLVQRRAQDAVYCSCRCNGPDADARYCECPSGFACVKLVDRLALEGAQLAGSYCVKEGTEYENGKLSSETCQYSKKNCGEVIATGEPKQ
jgi:hypothetical protein